MAVETFAFNGKKQIIGLRLTRISAHSLDQCVTGTTPKFGVAGFSNKFQRTCFHCNISPGVHWFWAFIGVREPPAATSGGDDAAGCKFLSAGMFK